MQMIYLLGMRRYVPPDWPLICLPSLHPILCLATVQLIPSSSSVYDGFWVTASSDSNRHVYNSGVEPVCTSTANADFGVRYIPLIGGILKTPQVTPTLNIIDNWIVITLQLIFFPLSLLPLPLGFNLWKGMLKKQPLSAFFLYCT